MPEHMYSRRKFIGTMTGAGSLIMLNPVSSWATDNLDPDVAAIVAGMAGVDTHNHVDVPLNPAELPGPDADLAGEMKKSGLAAICMTFAVDYQKLVNPGDAYNRFTTALTAMDTLLAANHMKRALNLAALKKAWKKHQPVVIQSVEGGHFLEGKLERLNEAYARGLRCLGLLHDNDAAVPLGDIYTNPVRWGGLTSFGADVIKACNALGILIDLTHGNNETVNAALKVTTKPVLITHTGLDSQPGKNTMMARMMRPRLISKEQAGIVAETGGVIGVWTHLADSPLEYAQNIRAMADVVGIDHVCIGTDTKLTPAYRSPRPDTAASGSVPNRERVGERTNRAWEDQQNGFLYSVVEAMLKTGFTKDEIYKIGSGNFCRLFDAVTSARPVKGQ